MSAPPAIVPAMLTTITVNGTEGFRFLSNLGAFREQHTVPPALAAMIDHASVARPHDLVSLEVEPRLAEEIAAFVDSLVHSGELGGLHEPPLLFSANTGDLVVLVRDALVEMHFAKKEREPRTWRHLARGTRGRLVERRGDAGKILILDGPEARAHAYVSDRSMTRARPVVQRQFLGTR
jgi:hypothetical protein